MQNSLTYYEFTKNFQNISEIYMIFFLSTLINKFLSFPASKLQNSLFLFTLIP